MSVDIKQIAEAIQKAGTDPVELEKVTKRYSDEFAELQKNADIGISVSEKGIFKQLKEAQEKLEKIEKERKEAEEREANEKGEYKTLAEKLKAEKEELENKFKTTSEIAEKWTSYEKVRREVLLGKIKDEKKKKIAEQLTNLETLEEFVELETGASPSGGSGNRHPDPPQKDKPIIQYKNMK